MEGSGLIENDCKILGVTKSCYFITNSAWTILLEFCWGGGAWTFFFLRSGVRQKKFKNHCPKHRPYYFQVTESVCTHCCQWCLRSDTQFDLPVFWILSGGGKRVLWCTPPFHMVGECWVQAGHYSMMWDGSVQLIFLLRAATKLTV